MQLGGGQDEDGVGGRLFECFEERVERAGGEHVDFVDDIDFVAAFIRREVNFVAQVADVVYAGVGGGVNFDEVEEAAFVDGHTVVTSVIGPLMGIGMGAVEGFGDEAGGGSFAGAAWTAKEIGVSSAAGGQRVLNRLDDVFLPDDFVEGGGSPFAVKCLIGHAGNYSRSSGKFAGEVGSRYADNADWADASRADFLGR